MSALTRDLPDIESLCRELESSAKQLSQSKAQAERQRKHATQLLSEKNDLEKQVVELTRNAAEAKTAHDAELQEKVKASKIEMATREHGCRVWQLFDYFEKESHISLFVGVRKTAEHM